ncbi:hypothetical protein [Thauera butanivorans]|uniref:hypothetical protein n=1 Tax=Thauera butanivorans TaxID=86174 RepID=UPI000B2156CC|nr:hypothetical protein [Thauera butanivorans]
MLRRLAGCLSPVQRARLHDWIPPALLRRLRAGADERAHDGSTQQATALCAEQAAARPFADILLVMEVDMAEALVGDLFRRRFRTDSFPQRPRHFVGFYRGADGALLPVGYVHHDTWNGNSLCGGLVIDERMYRRIPAVDREAIHAAGGVAEAMLRGSFALLEAGLVAIWAHVGNRQSEKVCHRVGYRRTDSEYVMVIWLRDDLSDAEKADWVRQIVAYGPF